MNFKNVKTATTKNVKHRSSFLLIYHLENFSHSKKVVGTLLANAVFLLLVPNVVYRI